MASDQFNIGSTLFNANDRLAILNVLNGVTIYYDDYDPDGLTNYIDCYTENGVFVLKNPGQAPQYVYKNPEPGQTGMYEFFGSRIQGFIEQGIQNRHDFSNKVLHYQTETRAKAIVNLLFAKNQQQADGTITLEITMSAQYDIYLEKIDHSWKIQKMVANVDN
tara:strand:- start:94 stop:582 length:489 start_codon:yes stop_codon:yes gene_type:complete